MGGVNIGQESPGRYYWRELGALVQTGHDEFAVSEDFSARHTAVAGADEHIKQLVAGLIVVHLAAEDAGHVDIDVLAHGTQGTRVAGQLDNRLNRVADNVALSRGEEVGNITAGAEKRHGLSGSGRGVHEPETGAGGRFSLVEAADNGSLAANLLNVAKSLFFDGGQAAFDVALGRLGVAKVIGLVILDNLLVTVEESLELLADVIIGAAGGSSVVSPKAVVQPAS